MLRRRRAAPWLRRHGPWLAAEATRRSRKGGHRRREAPAGDSAVPIDVISGDDFVNQGTTDMNSLLSTLVPSYNVNPQPISDAATIMRPANLRGLPPDNTLILVNGKRRHRGAVVAFLGGGIADGSQGPDLTSIPAIALKQVEVLRDGASAQYGSDAIAGVINFVLKDEPAGGSAEVRYGEYYEGDGESVTYAGNIGLPLTDAGFATSPELNDVEPTSRSVQRDDAQALIDAGNTAV
jgi:iron complex outermembrane receptor protein